MRRAYTTRLMASVGGRAWLRRNLFHAVACAFYIHIGTEVGPMAAEFYIGESLIGDGNEVAHIDLIIGSKSGHAGQAFVSALSNNKDGFTSLLAVVTPNLAAKPDTILFNKVTIKGAKQAVQMFGPAQAAVARAIVDSVSSGVIPRDKVDDYCVLVGVFIHWDAKDDKKIFDFNYRATKQALERALKGQPRIDDVIAGEKTARHPFASGAEG
ncbi:MAG TPA: formaldehyde-activating enzyme [Gemmatimonadaceae bacterium]